MKLNLGCGHDYREGWVNVDNRPGRIKVDVMQDLRCEHWERFDSGCATEVMMDQVLEHLPNTILVLRNIHRILNPGGVATIRVPFVGSYAAWNDPTHIRYFTPATFKYFERGHDAQHYIGCEFSKVETRWIDDDATKLARLRNLIPFRDTLCWLLWSMHDGIEARLTK